MGVAAILFFKEKGEGPELKKKRVRKKKQRERIHKGIVRGGAEPTKSDGKKGATAGSVRLQKWKEKETDMLGRGL